MKALRATQSLCPVCLRRVDAVYMVEAAASLCVYLHKSCPEHGEFRVPVWDASQGGPAFASWARPKVPTHPAHPVTPTRQGCPYDCGLCPQHGQHTCTGLVEVTQRCSMSCPICYASAGNGGSDATPDNTPHSSPDSTSDPSLAALDARFAALFRVSAGCNVQISGGEPTERADLPQIIRMARRYSFGLVQLNTNGRRLAQEAGYAATLQEAGLDSVYLQWDGVSDAAFQALRGQPCLEWKLQALQACTQAHLGVVLVATVVRGVNDGEMGALLRLGLAQGPCVRGVHFQPMAAFGRCPWPLAEAPRLTLPELIAALEQQAPDLIMAGQLHPPGCEHALCSCSAVYRRHGAGLECIAGSGCYQAPENGPESAADGARKAKQFTALHWRGSAAHRSQPVDAFSRFVAEAGVEQRFTVSAMAFQDALSLDLDRVRGCCIHVVADDGRLIPFCLYNMTSAQGVPLYRKPQGAQT